jgi:hypothetical protein
MRTTHTHSSGYAVLLWLASIAVVIMLSVDSFAQKAVYRAGEKIEYKTSYTKDEWAEGTFVEQTYDGSQPVIKDAQNFQKALPDWTWVRPIGVKPQPAEIKPAQDKGKGNLTVSTGEGLMSQADILGYLRANLGPDPFSDPRRYQVKSQLAAEIKRRGLSFHFDALSSFFNDMSKYIGVDSEISFPLKDNFGPPTEQGWLLGTWHLSILGATTEYEKGGYIYRKEASAVANTGVLMISADGSYTWQAKAPSATYRGRWRKATSAEMGTQGGDGVVLSNAKSGYDWIVIQNRVWKDQGDLIWVSDLSTRQLREVGSR